MIDLSFQLGIPKHELVHRLPQRDYWMYMHYGAKRLLPWQRIETHLAQISMLIAKTMGGASKATLNDFLFNVEPTIADRVEAARNVFGFNPRKKKAA